MPRQSLSLSDTTLSPLADPTAFPDRKKRKKEGVEVRRLGSVLGSLRKVVSLMPRWLVFLMVVAMAEEDEATEKLCEAYDADEKDREAPRWWNGE